MYSSTEPRRTTISTLRLFIAAEISEELRRKIDSSVEALKADLAPPVKWLPPSNYHITLRFLGDTSDSLVEPLSELLDGLKGTVGPANVTQGEAGCFPTCRRPRVVFGAVDDRDGVLSGWHTAVEEALEQRLALPKEDRPFRPHITVAYARDKGPGDRQRVQEAVERLSGRLTETPEELRRIVLFQTVLGPRGAAHEALHTSELP